MQSVPFEPAAEQEVARTSSIHGGYTSGGPPPRPRMNSGNTSVSRPSLARNTSFERSISRDSVPAALSSVFSSVVLLEVKFVLPIYTRPWTMSHQGGCFGSGFVIEGGRILTNHHVIANAIDIRLRKHGDSRRWRARVLVEGPDVDLALVVLHESVEPEEAAAFWQGVKPCTWNASLPSLQSSVNVVGYPTGGQTICVTEGVISRIDATLYNRGWGWKPGRVLVIQIDAAINPGNSGGPVFDKRGGVVGVAFQGLSSASIDNVGYIIPTCIVKNFLCSLEFTPTPSGQTLVEYPGLQESPFLVQYLQSKALRKYLKVPKDVTGVVVTEVAPLATKAALASGAKTFLQEHDVITHIDGRTIGDDYTVRLRNDELLKADFLITGKRKGEPTTFDVRRNGEKLRITATLGPLIPNVPRYDQRDAFPSWLLIGGLLFTKLTCPLIAGGTKAAQASGRVYEDICEAVSSYRTGLGTEMVLMISLFASETNFGYQNAGWRVLEKFNGVEVENLAHLYSLFNEAAAKVMPKAEAAHAAMEQAAAAAATAAAAAASSTGGNSARSEAAVAASAAAAAASSAASAAASAAVADAAATSTLQVNTAGVSISIDTAGTPTALESSGDRTASVDTVDKEVLSKQTGEAAAPTDGTHSEDDEFLIFQFRDESLIVLDAVDCLLSEAEILAQHSIHAAVSPNVVEEANARAAAAAAVAQEGKQTE